MYSRLLSISGKSSIFLFGPRGTGKSTWVRQTYPNALYFDLLETDVYKKFLAQPGRLEQYIPKGFSDYVVIDEVQRVPELLNEVHRLIENKKIKFILTGSSSRKLRRGGYNLLAGRALLHHMYPLTALEMKDDFQWEKALLQGMLPRAQEPDFHDYLQSYVRIYLDQEIQQEGLVRRLDNFSRFLEVASFSQGQVLNTSNVARDAEIQRMTVREYFQILQDLLIGYLLPPFTKRAKRRLVNHPKFYYFDPGVFRAIRPMGLYDNPQELGGICLETLVYQQISSTNDLLNLGYKLYYFRTASGVEVDFVLYGARGIVGLEVKLSSHFNDIMIRGLKNFAQDYPEARLFLIYTGERKLYIGNVTVLPLTYALHHLPELLSPKI
ncbi:MAG: ATP-binding protein [Patescibacteria group bacterium]